MTLRRSFGLIARQCAESTSGAIVAGSSRRSAARASASMVSEWSKHASSARCIATSAGPSQFKIHVSSTGKGPLSTRSRPMSTSAVRRQEDGAQEEKTEMDSGEKDIYDILSKQFQPKQLQVQDVSGGCGSFYAIAIQAKAFKGLPTVKAHRLVNEALKEVIAGIHGLQLRTMPADD